MSEERVAVEVSPPAAAQVPDERIYRAAPGELQLTVRAVGIGCLLGALIATINMYFGLKTGWAIGGSLLAAILSYATFAVLRPRSPFTVLETNVSQTAASAAGTMTFAAGLVTAIPALHLLERDFAWWELTAWAASVAWIGVFFAVPLRRQMVLVERLRFPSATATAHTIVAMFGSGLETIRRAKALLVWAALAAAFTLLAWFVKPLKDPPFHAWLPGAVLATLATYGFRLVVDPMLIGAGILVGMRVSASLAAGAVIAWGILAPWVTHAGWMAGPPLDPSTGARAWILWTGVAVMLADALTSLALSWRTIAALFRRSRPEGGVTEDPREAIPNPWWLGGLAVSTVAASVVLLALFQIPVHLTVLAIALSSILAAIAVRSSGETDINPVSGVAKVTQVVFGAVAPGQVTTNLMAAGLTGAGASQASDMMGDLKTGHLLGASARKQFVAQLVGIAAGVLVCVPVYLLVTKEGSAIGSPDLPAPSAYAWKATAEVLAVGLGAMPTNAQWGALAGAIFGTLVPLLRRFVPRTAPFLPSAMAFGIAFLVLPFMSFAFLYGAIAHAIWRARRPAQAADLAFAVASGILVGFGLSQIGTAILEALHVAPLVTLPR